MEDWFITGPKLNEHPAENTPQSSFTVPQLLKILQHGTVETEHGLMRWSSNYTFLVSVMYEGVEILAVYKPQKGERPLWDFPNGTLCLREVAAFHTSHQLGWQIVPPTVLRNAKHGLGSVQLYINHDPAINYFSLDESALPDLMRIAAFDYIVNNADRKGGHCLVDDEDHLWGIDHGITFHTAPKLRTVIWDFAGERVPDTLLEDIDALRCELMKPDSTYCAALENLLSEAEIKALETRITRLLKTKRYPKPGPGPNYPWPPV